MSCTTRCISCDDLCERKTLFGWDLCVTCERIVIRRALGMKTKNGDSRYSSQLDASE
jgi:hypothetical protein